MHSSGRYLHLTPRAFLEMNPYLHTKESCAPIPELDEELPLFLLGKKEEAQSVPPMSSRVAAIGRKKKRLDDILTLRHRFWRPKGLPRVCWGGSILWP